MNETVNETSNSFELIAILFVSHGSQHILFKYPFSHNSETSKQFNQSSKRNLYALSSTDYLNFWIVEKEEKLISNGLLKGFESSILENIFFITKKRNEPLELKVDNLFFLASSNVIDINNVSYNIVFAVKSPLPKPVISCYQRLSFDIVNALIKEESNYKYLSHQLKNFLCEEQTSDKTYAKALEKSQLAEEFKQIYEDIKNNGVVNIVINKHLHLSFCLPHLAYKIKEKCEQTHFVNVILNSKEYLKSYHGILLLTPKDIIIKSLPNDCNYLLRRLLEIYSPRYSITHYAAELDSSDEQIKVIIIHLIQWAKVKIIYPITDTNVYVIHPNSQIFVNNLLSQAFSEKFSGFSLPLVLEQFSVSQTLIDHMNPTLPREMHQKMLEIVIWLLERNLLLQTHTYIYLVVKKFQFVNDNLSKSETSIETNFDQDSSNIGGGCGGGGGGGGSEHSNDTDYTDNKDAFIFEKYRKALSDFGLNEKEQQYVLGLLHGKSEAERKLFIKLIRYFNGIWNIEEIIYEEKINRSDVYMLLESFKSVLIVSVYEDPNPLLRINVKIA